MSVLVDTKEDLIRYFESGAKPRERWRVGTEYEKIAVVQPAREQRTCSYGKYFGTTAYRRISYQIETPVLRQSSGMLYRKH